MAREKKIPAWCEVTEYRPGDILWHGTARAHGIDDLQRPSWVSNSHAVASDFARWRLDDDRGVSRVLKYMVVQHFALPSMSSRSLEPLGLWVSRLIDNRPPDDETDDPDYYNGYEEHEIDGMAEAVCRAGFHGWRIINNYSLGDDIMLCKPDRLLRRVQAGRDWRPRR